MSAQRAAGPSRVHLADLVGDPADLVGPGVEGGGPNLGGRGAGRRLQQPEAVDRSRRAGGVGPERLAEHIGHVQDRPAAAPVHRQREGRGRPPVAAAEPVGKGQDVARRRSAPAVDGLKRVADRGHRVAEAFARRTPGEQPAQHRRLRGRGVLVLIEQHHPEGGAQCRRDLRDLGGQPGGDRHLVGELHQPEPGLQGLVVQHQAGQLQTFLGHDDGPLHVGVRPPPVVQRRGFQGHQQVPGVLVELGRVDQVLLQVAVQLEHPLGHGGRSQPGDELERPRRRLHHPRGQPVAGGAGDHGRVHLEAQPDAVLGDQPAGEGVVGHDQLLARLVDPRTGDHPGPEQGLADPLGQLRRRLPGEGQTEHLLGSDGSGADQPDHPGRHHRGLARARLRR